MAESQFIRVPPACSPLESIYLLAVLMRGQLERLDALDQLLPLEQRGVPDAARAGLKELHWRARAILDGADPGPCRDEAQLALLELAGLGGETGGGPARATGWGAGRRQRRLREELERGRERLGSAVAQCRELFPDCEYQDEFRLLAGLVHELTPPRQ